MNPELDSHSDLRLDNKFDAENEDAQSFYGENEEEDYNEENNQEENEDKIKVSGSYLIDRQDNFEDFDYGIYEKREVEEEEEEEIRDLQGYGFSPSAYDLRSFREEGLSDEERQDIIEKLKELLDESRVLMVANKFLHKNYINAMRNSVSFSHALEKFDETMVFEDDRYLTTLEKYIETRVETDEQRESLSEILENLEQTYIFDQSAYTHVFENLISRELAIAKKIRPLSHTKESWQVEVDDMLENQQKRIIDISKIRLTYVRLHNKLKKFENDLRKFDSLGPGYSMMDYEYLLKRKDVYSEKCIEQLEHIKTFKDKNLACAAIVRHVDEDTILFKEKVNEKSKDLNDLLKNNQIERSKAVELAKKKVSMIKNITNLKEEIGLLNYPFLAKKMPADVIKTKKLKRRIEDIESKIKAHMKNNKLRQRGKKISIPRKC